MQDLLMGQYPEELPRDRWLILTCQQGIVSARAADYLKRKGYHVKLLLGGIEGLDRLLPLTFNDPHW